MLEYFKQQEYFQEVKQKYENYDKVTQAICHIYSKQQKDCGKDNDICAVCSTIYCKQEVEKLSVCKDVENKAFSNEKKPIIMTILLLIIYSVVIMMIVKPSEI